MNPNKENLNTECVDEDLNDLLEEIKKLLREIDEMLADAKWKEGINADRQCMSTSILPNDEVYCQERKGKTQ